MIALIATDLDGTFLGADKLPSAENTEAMFAAADAGVHVVFATGRPYRWLTVLDPFPPDPPNTVGFQRSGERQCRYRKGSARPIHDPADGRRHCL